MHHHKVFNGGIERAAQLRTTLPVALAPGSRRRQPEVFNTPLHVQTLASLRTQRTNGTELAPAGSADASVDAPLATAHADVVTDAHPQRDQLQPADPPSQDQGDDGKRGYRKSRGRSQNAQVREGDQATPSTSGSQQPWPGRNSDKPYRNNRQGSYNPSHETRRGPPVYATALSGFFSWPRQRHISTRADFLNAFPVPTGKTFNVNSFLGKRDPLGGQYLVPQDRYLEFLTSYHEALESGVQMFLTENYHQQVFKYFVELDWEWDTDLALVMDVTPQLLDLIARVAGEFYRVTFPNMITSIRTPYKVHVNFPQLLTTELLACMCRDRILEACRERFPQHADRINWERLIDFPHGSLRLMGSRKSIMMDRDPEWVQEKAYYPARLTDGKWRPGKLTVALLGAASIFPPPRQAAAFERTPAYVDMIFMDCEAYRAKIEERRRRRAAAEMAQQADATGRRNRNQGGGRELNLPPGSSKNPLHVTIEVKPDETVSLNVYIKSKYRGRQAKSFTTSEEGAGSRIDAATGTGTGVGALEAGGASTEDTGTSSSGASGSPAVARSAETAAAVSVLAATSLTHSAGGMTSDPEGAAEAGAGAPESEVLAPQVSAAVADPAGSISELERPMIMERHSQSGTISEGSAGPLETVAMTPALSEAVLVTTNVEDGRPGQGGEPSHGDALLQAEQSPAALRSSEDTMAVKDPEVEAPVHREQYDTPAVQHPGLADPGERVDSRSESGGGNLIPSPPPAPVTTVP